MEIKLGKYRDISDEEHGVPFSITDGNGITMTLVAQWSAHGFDIRIVSDTSDCLSERVSTSQTEQDINFNNWKKNSVTGNLAFGFSRDVDAVIEDKTTLWLSGVGISYTTADTLEKTFYTLHIGDKYLILPQDSPAFVSETEVLKLPELVPGCLFRIDGVEYLIPALSYSKIDDIHYALLNSTDGTIIAEYETEYLCDNTDKVLPHVNWRTTYQCADVSKYFMKIPCGNGKFAGESDAFELKLRDVCDHFISRSITHLLTSSPLYCRDCKVSSMGYYRA